LDLARGEAIEKELEAFIAKRSRQEPDRHDLEPSYAASVRRYHSRQRKENVAAWYAYHADQAKRLRRTLTALAEHHETQAIKLLEGISNEQHRR
jgi:hypothetical protein